MAFRLLILVLLINTVSCTPMIHPAGISTSTAKISTLAFTTQDGSQLPLKTWQPEKQAIKAVIIAIHGFNDYSNFFHQPGVYFSQHNIISYAYDQRGFGASPNPGLWAGIDTYIADLNTFIALVKTLHPDTPVFLLGESMGGAIVISTVTATSQPHIDGIILSAPAVWARATMPWYQNTLLWTLSHTMPWLTLTGKDLGIKPSDNIEMLRALGKDPLVIKETRVESIYGLVNLMDKALSSANKISANALLLYGEKDEIIPKQPTYEFLNNLRSDQEKQHTIAFYKNGYHMLLRDLQANVPLHDISTWIESFTTPLPSKADKRADIVLNPEK